MKKKQKNKRDEQVHIQVEKVFFEETFDLQGQLAPSGVLDGVLPSGQQPNSVLSQEDLSSAVGTVVLATVGPEGDTQGLIIIHEASENVKKKSRQLISETQRRLFF